MPVDATNTVRASLVHIALSFVWLVLSLSLAGISIFALFTTETNMQVDGGLYVMGAVLGSLFAAYLIPQLISLVTYKLFIGDTTITETGWLINRRSFPLNEVGELLNRNSRQASMRWSLPSTNNSVLLHLSIGVIDGVVFPSMPTQRKFAFMLLERQPEIVLGSGLKLWLPPSFFEKAGHKVLKEEKILHAVLAANFWIVVFGFVGLLLLVGSTLVEKVL